MIATLAPPLNGLSFDVPDLLLARSWAAFHGLRMRVHLDRSNDSGQTDEVLAFHAGDGAPARWLAWRDEGTVYVQPAAARTVRFTRLADALESLIPEPTAALTDLAGLPAR
jgi:hypothetical protein